MDTKWIRHKDKLIAADNISLIEITDSATTAAGRDVAQVRLTYGDKQTLVVADTSHLDRGATQDEIKDEITKSYEKIVKAVGGKVVDLEKVLGDEITDGTSGVVGGIESMADGSKEANLAEDEKRGIHPPNSSPVATGEDGLTYVGTPDANKTVKSDAEIQVNTDTDKDKDDDKDGFKQKIDDAHAAKKRVRASKPQDSLDTDTDR